MIENEAPNSDASPNPSAEPADKCSCECVREFARDHFWCAILSAFILGIGVGTLIGQPGTLGFVREQSRRLNHRLRS